MLKASDPFTGHGGRLDAMARAFPDAPFPWIDLSTGINPYAYPLPEIDSEIWARLPGEGARNRCEVAMANTFGCAPAHCRAVPGTEIAIRQLPAILCAKSVALRMPSYADHAQSWAASGAEVHAVADPLQMADRSDVVVLVNPNNPDGHCWPVERIEQARLSLAARRGWLIIDEAYAELDPAGSSAPQAGKPGLIVLRSFGKFFGLAGVRLGAMLAPPEILCALDQRLGGWDVSGPAQVIGAAAYADQEWQDATRRHLVGAMRSLQQVLAQACLNDVGGTDLFRFVQVPDAPALWRSLAERGIAVRRFADDAHHLRFGLPPDDAALARLAAALSPSA